MRKMNLKVKRMLSLLVAMVMVLSMGVFSVAASDDPNMTNSSTQWTIEATAGSTVRLYASPANSSWTATGFTQPVEGQPVNKVDWTSTNEAIAKVKVVDNVEQVGFETAPANITGLAGLYCAYADIEVVGSETGSCSIQATNANVSGKPYVNFTIVVKPATPEGATDVRVDVYGLKADNSKVSSTALTVAPSADLKFATVMDSLEAFKTATADADKKFSYVAPSAGYVTTLTYGDDSKSAEGWEGWNYRVYNYDEEDDIYYMDATSTVVGANVCQVKTDSVVVWKYGTADAAKTFFDTLTVVPPAR